MAYNNFIGYLVSFERLEEGFKQGPISRTHSTLLLCYPQSHFLRFTNMVRNPHSWVLEGASALDATSRSFGERDAEHHPPAHCFTKATLNNYRWTSFKQHEFLGHLNCVWSTEVWYCIADVSLTFPQNKVFPLDMFD